MKYNIILRASKNETMKRAINRSKLDKETNIELVEIMWEQFNNLGVYEVNAVDTTELSVFLVKEKIRSKTFML